MENTIKQAILISVKRLGFIDGCKANFKLGVKLQQERSDVISLLVKYGVMEEDEKFNDPELEKEYLDCKEKF